MKKILQEQVVAYKALNDVTRIKILQMLKLRSMYTNEILDEFNITQPTLSYHMKILSSANLVDTKKVGRNVYYCLNRKTINHLIDFLSQIVKVDGEQCKDLNCSK
ncbi:ArsR/SmtB family transcription factor [Mageeibacillus indolicus]|jgi:hypothetical protein|uniref:Transcriptional regulator, ArsR family n=2 Tax=Mageeibacillus indolicus TaxID=884684 RepID=D3R293_MAGIU|nr:metalloregulator ArsR/SmtB family transcription factor [Mageeibacillus indolicus]ADC91358.1 transcriptional regulator, ArsR family [Mageeibacillus indolicus UPII9-5]KFA57852.1 hypothetical protein HMPREF1632_00905 [Mageeibacillus indolicus 0009-5]PNH19787.1 transcriptional regulator [Mageeibacillus indolicus]